MAAPTSIARQHSGDVSGGTTFAAASGAVAGDVQLLAVTCWQGYTVTTPTGWAPLGASMQIATWTRLTLFTRTLDATTAAAGFSVSWTDRGAAEVRTLRGQGLGFSLRSSGAGLVTDAISVGSGSLVRIWSGGFNNATGQQTGTFTPDVTTAGATPAYSYSWFSGLVSGIDPAAAGATAPARTATMSNGAASNQWATVEVTSVSSLVAKVDAFAARVRTQFNTVKTQINALGGMYQGAWVDGAEYIARDTVTHEGFLYAAKEDGAELEPGFNLSASTPVGGTAWSRNSVSSSNVDEVILIAGNNDTGSVVTTETFVGWEDRELSFDVALSGSADEINFGILDAAQPATSLATGMAGVTGFWGVSLDIWNGTVTPIVNGVKVGGVGYAPTTSGAYVTHSIQITGTTMVVRRAGAVIRTQTITAPTFSSFRFAIGARAGGFSGTFKVRGTPGAPGDWDVVAVTDGVTATEIGNIEAADFVALFENTL